ncbi:DUF4199 domain-containing protein [Marinoscillum pacificum]|uniref:DUF4199 domain-containing protein n=1 Tax=Marinoscillum pacificum TaxID=392723 RepID=UPI002157A35D|nr:DUF4199 domain-containing protein [Marinoscillum pacificum]
MKKNLLYALKYGAIGGAIIVFGWYLAHQVLSNEDGSFNMERSEILGYAAMLLAFVAVFIGVKNYRDKELNGSISFGKAYLIGMYIVLVTTFIYVAGWMIYFPLFIPDFPDQFMASQLKSLEESGMTGVELEAKREEMASFMDWYRQPLNMIGMTIVEILPIGLIVALISALVWKKK